MIIKNGTILHFKTIIFSHLSHLVYHNQFHQIMLTVNLKIGMIQLVHLSRSVYHSQSHPIMLTVNLNLELIQIVHLSHFVYHNQFHPIMLTVNLKLGMIQLVPTLLILLMIQRILFLLPITGYCFTNFEYCMVNCFIELAQISSLLMCHFLFSPIADLFIDSNPEHFITRKSFQV